MLVSTLLLTGLALTAPCPLDPLVSDGTNSHWAGIEMHATVAEIEAKLGERLGVVPDDAMPGYLAELPAAWGSIVLHFEEHAGAERLTGMTMQGPDEAANECWSRKALIAAVKERAPKARYQPSRHDPDVAEADNAYPIYLLSREPDVVVLLKPGYRTAYFGLLRALD